MPRPQTGLDRLIYEYITEPLALNMCHISPNVVTLVGLFASSLASGLLVVRPQMTAVWAGLFVFHFICDCLDGSIARGCNTGSSFGHILDHGCDILSAIVLFLAILRITRDPFQRTVAWAIVIGKVVGILVLHNGTVNELIADNLSVRVLLKILALRYLVRSNKEKTQ